MDALSPKYNFDTLGSSITTIFQVLTGENWQIVMYDVVRCNGSKLYMIYFVLLIIVCNFMMLSLFLAILLGNFMEVRESIELERLRKKRDLKLHLRNVMLARNTD